MNFFKANHTVKCFIYPTDKKVYQEFVGRLKKDTAGLQTVSTVQESDLILAFCIVTSNQETSIRGLLQSLQSISETKPVALVVLHHTFDEGYFVTDSKRYVNEEAEVTVDCLFFEDKLLHCYRNEQSLNKITKFIQQLKDGDKPTHDEHGGNVSDDSVVQNKRPKREDSDDQNMTNKTLKYLVFPMGDTENVHEKFMKKIEQKREISLEKTSMVEDCDFLLSFYTVVTRNETNIKTVLKMLHELSAGKPTALVVLHQTVNPNSKVPDSSKAGKEQNITVVDCLLHDHTSKCNEEAVDKIFHFIKSQVQPSQPPAVKPVKCYIFKTADTLNVERIVKDVTKQIPYLQLVRKVDECDYILCLCPVVSRAGTDIISALQKLDAISGSKPAVLVVLHHTFNTEQVVPDSSRAVNRRNLITVDCLFHESGLLTCNKNNQALTKIKEYIIQVPKHQRPDLPPRPDSVPPNLPMITEKGSGFTDDSNQAKHSVKCYIVSTGKTPRADKTFMEQLIKAIPDLQKVNTEQESDFILVFCPVASQYENDIKAALNLTADTKPAAVVMLHHTHDKDRVVSDRHKVEGRKNLIIVDCLFYEDYGLLECQKNNESLGKVTNFIQQVQPQKQQSNTETKKPGLPPRPDSVTPNLLMITEKGSGFTDCSNHAKHSVKCYIELTGETLRADENFMEQLIKAIPDLQKVNTEQESDFILAFCPVVTQYENDFKAALNLIADTKPAAVVMLHHTHDKNHVVSYRVEGRKNVITVDCLFYKDCGLLKCQKNLESLNTVTNFIQQVQSQKQQNKTGTANKKINYLVFPMGETQNVHEKFIDQLNKIINLQKCSMVEDCDILLSFYTAVTRNETKINSVLTMLQELSAGKPTALVVLHQKYSDFSVADSSKAVKRQLNLIAVDYLINDCQNNDEVLVKIINFIQEKCNTTDEQMETEEPLKTDMKPLNFYLRKCTNKNITADLKAMMPNLHQVFTEEQCDFILVFCPAGPSGVNIKLEMEMLHHTSDTKPTILMVLHHTDFIVPDRSRAGSSKNACVVDCLFHDEGLLQCRQNDESLANIKNIIQRRCQRDQTGNKSIETDVMFLIYKSENNLNIDKTITHRLKEQIPGLREVKYADQCDFILGFCPVHPQAEIDIKTKLQLLHNISDTKPIFLVVLHHTDLIVPESRAVNRENAFAVDCLVDAQGLLQCHKNKKSLAKIVNFLQSQMYV